MLKTYRAFTTEFLLHIDRRGGFPPDKQIRAWFRASYHKGIRGQDLVHLRHGRWVQTKATAGVLSMLLAEATRSSFHARHALLDYLAQRGLQNPTLADLERVIAHTCTPISTTLPQEHSTDQHGTRSKPAPSDDLCVGPPALFGLAVDYLLRQGPRACRPDCQDVEVAVEWMFIRVAQSVHPDGPRMAHRDAIQWAETYIKTPLTAYQQRARSWQEHNPWTVVVAKGDAEVDAGLSIVLPLNKSAYESLLAGERPSYAIGPDDFEIPSRHLVIEACNENPNAPVSSKPPTKLLMCLMLQLSALMRYGHAKRTGEFRWLSFAGTPTGRERLQGNGFRPTGRHMAETGVEYLERVFDFDADASTPFLWHSFLYLGGKFCPPAPPMK